MKKLNAKSVVLIVIICLIAILLLSLVLVSNLNKDKENPEISTTTTTTEKIKEQLSFTDEITNINLLLKNSESITDNIKLVVEKIENVKDIKNLISVYDIKFVDENNSVIEIKDNEINISIPYENSLNYKEFNILYLSDTNEILETIPATYENGFIKFKTTHLSKYAIQGIKEEEITTTVKPTTTKKVETTKPTTKPTTQTTTTSTTTTKKVKTYSYTWGTEKDAAGQQYLYIIDNDGKVVSGSVTISYVGSNYSETKTISTNGILLVKDIVTISNVKGN